LGQDYPQGATDPSEFQLADHGGKMGDKFVGVNRGIQRAGASSSASSRRARKPLAA